MCTLLFAIRAHPDIPLLIAANRDEFYARPTEPAEFWSAAPTVLAGRDLKAGGTWLGITRTGRWAGLTNIRDPGNERRDALSRGHLVSEFLAGDTAPAEYARTVAAAGAEYNGFNLLVGDRESVWYASNYLDRAGPGRSGGGSGGRSGGGSGGESGSAYQVTPGVHGVSNHVLDTDWPKVVHGRSVLRAAVQGESRPAHELAAGLLDELQNPQPFADELLPDTGIGLEWERKLSSLFIATPVYGTCSSTVIAVHSGGEVYFAERTTNPKSAAAGSERALVEARFALDAP